MKIRRATSGMVLAGLAVLFGGHAASAVEMPQVYTGSLDQPRINMLIRIPGPVQTDPLDGTTFAFDFENIEIGEATTWNLTGFLDTGASAILIATSVAAPAEFDIPMEAGWTFEDVGVAGAVTQFGITQPLDIRLAPYNSILDFDNPPNPGAVNDAANQAYWNNLYNHSFPGHRAIVGPIHEDAPVPIDPLEQFFALATQVNVFGMPLFKDKVAVFDGRAVNNFVNSGGDFDLLDPTSFPELRSYLYAPGTPYNDAQNAINPGIPDTTLHIATSYADFTRFTRVLGDGAEMPAFAHNPFIGANPVNVLEGIPDNTPGIELQHLGTSQSGSFLFDTGAAATIISNGLAAGLNVRYKPGFEPDVNNDTPILEQFVGGQWVELGEEQFELTISGIDGSLKIAGFFVEDFTVPTIEGDDLHYSFVPVLIHDVATSDPITGDVITLDGIFGMNLLFGTMFVDEPVTLDSVLGAPMTPGAFDWVTFDETTGMIGLQLNSSVIPEPTTGMLLVASATCLLWRRRR